ncbi:MAG: NUDIX hydrolase [Acidimicrobiales bacterium]
MKFDPTDLSGLLDQDYRESEDEAETPKAAVAAVFRAAEPAIGTELLFIQRATKPTDPWSGQMAFPGGRKEDRDPSPQATAARETSEEVGLQLDPGSYIGSLTELDGGRANNRRIIVSAHAFWLDGPRPRLQPNHEVADALWVPLAHLADTKRYIDYEYPLTESLFPGIMLDRQGQVIWGLTLRLLSDLFARFDHPFIIEHSD